MEQAQKIELAKNLELGRAQVGEEDGNPLFVYSFRAQAGTVLIRQPNGTIEWQINGNRRYVMGYLLDFDDGNKKIKNPFAELVWAEAQKIKKHD